MHVDDVGAERDMDRARDADPVCRQDQAAVGMATAEAVDVLSQASEQGGVPLHIIGFTRPPDGMVVAGATDTDPLLFTPAPNFHGSTSFSLAVAMREQTVAQRTPPPSEPANRWFFRPSATGRIARSTGLLSSSIRPSSRKRMSPSQWFKA